MPRCAHDGCQRWRPLWLAPGALSFDGAWFCHPACLREEALQRLKALATRALTDGAATRFRLGTALLASRTLTAPVLQLAIARQRESGRRLGAELLDMGVVDVGALTHALARQAGIPSIAGLTPTHVACGVLGLPRHVVRALRLLPFEVDASGVLRVAVTAPVPYTALRALERMKGRSVRPFMVGDAPMAGLLAAYGAAGAIGDNSALLASPDEAAAHIAEAVRAGRAEAWRCEPAASFTWVRLEGTRGVDDLIVKRLGEGDTWQAAPTRP